jgi:hypothetical protein
MCKCRPKKSSCKSQSKDFQDPTAWENDERLKRNYNLPLEDLLNRLKEKKEEENCSVSLDDTVYVYVVQTTNVDSSYNIYQHGCGPNFEGGIITLTNCKHPMRCSGELKKYINRRLWIAGVTSKDRKNNYFKKNFLFFLMNVDETVSAISFYDLWNTFGRNNQAQAIRNTKNARYNPLGDIYEPMSNCNFNVGNNRWDPNCYHPPRHDHSHYPSYITQCNHRYRQNPNCWINCNRNKDKEGCWAEDIAYHRRRNQNNRPLLLVGENPFIGRKENSICFNSYLWTKAMIEFVCPIRRGHRVMSLKDFLYVLRKYP